MWCLPNVCPVLVWKDLVSRFDEMEGHAMFSRARQVITLSKMIMLSVHTCEICCFETNPL